MKVQLFSDRMDAMVIAIIALLLCIFGKAAGCGETYTSATGTIRHPAESERYYKNNDHCEWVIKSSAPLYFYFSKFITETDHDKLIARDGGSIGSPLIGRFSGKSLNSTFLTTGDTYVRFQSDANVVGAGFVLHWKHYSAEEQCKYRGGSCVISGQRCGGKIEIIRNSCDDRCVCCLPKQGSQPFHAGINDIFPRSLNVGKTSMDRYDEYSGVMVAGQMLQFRHEELSWHDAKEFCSTRNSQLVSLVDPEAFLSFISTIKKDEIHFWLGGSDIANEGEWVWLNGNPLGDQFPWLSHPYVQPDNGGGVEHCLMFGWEGGFNDGKCYQKKRFICEVCPDGVVIGRQCFKFHNEQLSWEDANQKCSSQDARLAILNDPLAFQDYARANYGGEKFWLGGSDSANEGEFVWLNGQALGAGFPWGQGQPDNGNGIEQDCLHWGYESSYDDKRCIRTIGFVCEQKIRKIMPDRMLDSFDT